MQNSHQDTYETDHVLLYTMKIIRPKWKLPIIWLLHENDNGTLRYTELQRRVQGVNSAMLTRCLRELEHDRMIIRKTYNTIPPTVEYSLTERGKSLFPALDSLYKWAEVQMLSPSDTHEQTADNFLAALMSDEFVSAEPTKLNVDRYIKELREDDRT